MRALCWHGKEDIRVDTVPDPQIRDPRDIIVKISSTAICGSDLHIYGGFVPSMLEEAGLRLASWHVDADNYFALAVAAAA